MNALQKIRKHNINIRQKEENKRLRAEGSLSEWEYRRQELKRRKWEKGKGKSPY